MISNPPPNPLEQRLHQLLADAPGIPPVSGILQTTEPQKFIISFATTDEKPVPVDFHLIGLIHQHTKLLVINRNGSSVTVKVPGELIAEVHRGNWDTFAVGDTAIRKSDESEWKVVRVNGDEIDVCRTETVMRHPVGDDLDTLEKEQTLTNQHRKHFRRLVVEQPVPAELPLEGEVSLTVEERGTLEAAYTVWYDMDADERAQREGFFSPSDHGLPRAACYALDKRGLMESTGRFGFIAFRITPEGCRAIGRDYPQVEETPEEETVAVTTAHIHEVVRDDEPTTPAEEIGLVPLASEGEEVDETTPEADGDFIKVNADVIYTNEYGFEGDGIVVQVKKIASVRVMIWNRLQKKNQYVERSSLKPLPPGTKFHPETGHILDDVDEAQSAPVSPPLDEEDTRRLPRGVRPPYVPGSDPFADDYGDDDPRTSEEIEYDRLRTTYPTLPPYEETVDDVIDKFDGNADFSLLDSVDAADKDARIHELEQALANAFSTLGEIQTQLDEALRQLSEEQRVNAAHHQLAEIMAHGSQDGVWEVKSFYEVSDDLDAQMLNAGWDVRSETIDLAARRRGVVYVRLVDADDGVEAFANVPSVRVPGLN